MQNIQKNFKRWGLATSLMTLLVASCTNNNNPNTQGNFQQVNLVANNGNYAADRIDPNFIGGWGFDFSPFGPAFISSHGNGTSVVYGYLGEERRDPIAIPGVGEVPLTGKPSGVVFNGTNTFFLTNFAPARFIYAGTDGIISAWNVDNNAEVVVDNSITASYTGVAIGQNAGIDYLYVANFKEARIQVFTGLFAEVASTFTDPAIPAGYAPYNIRNIDGKLFVTYAKQGANGDVETGAGKGYVNIFNTDGTLSKRFASGGKLNAPWGIAKVGHDFATPSVVQPNSILVGNYGDGRINVHSPGGNYKSTISNPVAPISIQGLRNIGFAPDSVVSERTKLFFTASPNSGQDGLFGYVQEVIP